MRIASVQLNSRHRRHAGVQHQERRQVDGELEDAAAPVNHRGEVAKALAPLEAAHRQRVVVGQHAEVALAPAQPLRVERGHVLGRLAADHALADPQRLPAPRVHAQAGVHVLRDRLDGDVADLLQRLAAEDGRAAGEDRGVPVVAAGLDDVVEELPLLPVRGLRVVEPGLERLEVVEGVRRLHETQLFVLKIPDKARDEVRVGDVVGVEDDDEFAVGLGEGVVEVARLGVAVVRADHVRDAQLLGQRLRGRPLAVVAQVNPFVRVVQPQAGLERHAQQVGVLVVGRHENVHRPHAVQQRLLRRLVRVPYLQEVQEHVHDAVQLADEEEQRGEYGVRRRQVEGEDGSVKQVDEGDDRGRKDHGLAGGGTDRH